MKKILILIMVLLILSLTACSTSSYVSCKEDCRSYEDISECDINTIESRFGFEEAKQQSECRDSFCYEKCKGKLN